MDDFEASQFSFNNSKTKLPLVKAHILLEEILSNAAHVSLSIADDIKPLHPIRIPSLVLFDGDKQPKHRSGKLFQFVAVLSRNHILKMELTSSIDCTIVKSMKDVELGYGVAFTIITHGSISKELYEVTISDFLACTCKGF